MQAQRLSRRSFWLLLLIPLTLASYFGWQYFKSPKEQTHLPTARVERGNLQDQVTATGTLKPANYVDVGAQISGQLTHLHVEVGDQVEAGQLLAEIDARVLEANVAASRAQLRAQAAQLRDRQAQLQLAKHHYQRQQNLRADDAVTEEALQQAEASYLSSQAQVEQLQAQIEQNQSSLAADEANLEYARILAPISGTVVSISARQGQTLNANQQAPVILQVADLSQMRVETRVSEADISRLRPGMPAYFTTLGSQNQRWQGQLLRIEPTPVIENNVVLYNAPFDVENRRGQLLPQMTAQVFFVVAQTDNALLIPTAALQRVQRNQYQVRVLAADGSQQLREVQIGVNNRIQAEVLSGLEEGEVVVLQTGGQQNRATGNNTGNINRPTGMPRL
ncbi:efflux RND transporter periplasmic adaptor subunit [Marinospirillum alkaliphilum]|uniref:Membrane fusion protein, macrolide-specific efflux system n=1 Tax=Marinospirillum alkaliphilum DSM 21637 TaxID=1122209 RepID=A0A1K1UXD9_9GAMM|nr:efflux RND transporter periplasmic adaptor subunit [Marinospirillum alkaliphilum]SFX17187.1 membrane fusion protein, macrolide-specific efflux system [Marinospirillum alkaliphilum DSM 21637]